MKVVCFCVITVCHLHDFCGRTVGPFRVELDAPQVFWRDDPGLHLQTATVCVVVPTDWRHTCQQEHQLEHRLLSS